MPDQESKQYTELNDNFRDKYNYYVSKVKFV